MQSRQVNEVLHKSTMILSFFLKQSKTMKNMRFFTSFSYVMVRLFLILMFVYSLAFAQEESNWQNFRGNKSLNGEASVNLPKSLKLL